MSALNFPDNPADVGNVYVGDNGITYDYVNGKWRGRTAPGTGGGSTGTSWNLTSQGNGCPIDVTLTTTTFDVRVPRNHLLFNEDGSWDIGSYTNGNYITGDTSTNFNIVTNFDQNVWTFGGDGILTLPTNTTVNPNVSGSWQVAAYSSDFDGTGRFKIVGISQDNNYFIVESTSGPGDLHTGNLPLGRAIWATGFPTATYISERLVNPDNTDQLLIAQSQFTTSTVTVPQPGGLVLHLETSPNSLDLLFNETTGLSIKGDYVNGQWTKLGIAGRDWKFDQDGKLTLPNGASIGSSGSLLGIPMTTDRGTVLFGNSPECVPTLLTHFHIMKEDPSAVDLFLGDDYNFVKLPGNQIGETAYGVEIGTNGGNGANTWRFGTDGVLTLPVSTTGTSVIKSTTSTNITVAGVAGITSSLAWYNIFGELNNSTSTNVTIDGSVVYDTEGNLYVLGSTYADGDNFPGANLFLKYSPQGELLWRKTWTDPVGDACGSYNASMRFQPMAGTATIDTIVWASNGDSWTTSDRSGYIGTMDLEGNLVDLQGRARAPLALPDYRITDIVPLFYEVFNGAYVSGSWYDRADTGWNFPAIAGVDFNDVNDNVNWIFIPTDLAGGSNGGGHFKSINAVFGGLWATGSYNTSANGYYVNRTILGLLDIIGGDPGSPTPYLYTIGNNYPEYSMWIEDSGSDADSNIYGLINVWGYNNDTRIQYNNHTVLASATLNSTLTIDRWQKKIRRAGADDGGLTVHGLGLANHEGYVYVSVRLSDNSGGDGDFGLLKLDSTTGAIVWARTIGSPFGDGVWNEWEGGYGSSSDIVVDPTGNYISFTAITSDQSTGTQFSNNFTIQYPLDGSLLGTFNDFSITDSIAEFVVTDHDFDVVDITSTSNITTATFTVTTATLTASATTVGEGWTNFRWPLEAEVTGTADKTWTFGADGTTTFPDGTTIGSAGFTAPLQTDFLINTFIDNTGDPGTKTWTFGIDGNLTIPHGGKLGFDLLAKHEYGAIALQSLGGVGTYAAIASPYSFVQVRDNEVEIQSRIDGETIYNWTFGADGGLTIPGDIQDANGSVIRVATTSTAPTRENGQLWFNNQEGRTYIKYNGQWLDASPTQIPSPETYLDDIQIDGSTLSVGDYAWTFGGATDTFPGDIYDAEGPIVRVATTSTAPTRANGQLWFNSEEGRTYIKYNGAWVDANPTQILSPSTYLDDIQVDGSEFLINGYSLTVDETGTLLVDGQQVTGGGSNGWQLNSGTQTLSISSSTGDIILDGPAGASNRGIVWNWGAESGGVNSTIYQSDNGLYVRPFAVGTSTYAEWNFGIDGYLTLPINDVGDSVIYSDTGNIELYTNNGPGSEVKIRVKGTGDVSWVFGDDGVLTLPAGGSRVTSYGQLTIETDNGGSGMYANATGVNLLYANTNVTLRSNSTGTTNDWTFGANGILTLSTASTILGNSSDPNVYIETSTTSTTSTWTFGADGNLTLPVGGTIHGGGTGTDVTVVASTGTNPAVWAFAANGTLTFPDSTVQTTAFTGTVAVEVGELIGDGAAAQVGSSLYIITNNDGGLGGWNSNALSIAYDPTVISTYPVGSTITWQDGTTATITMWDDYGPIYIDLFWDTPKSGTLFPLTLKTANYADAVDNTARVVVTTGTNTSTWTFDAGGGLTFPDATVQTTAYVPATASASTYTGWFRPAETVVQLDTLLARINSTGTMQISTTIVETEPTGAAFAWNGVRNQGATMSAFGEGGENWVNPGDWLDISATPLDNNFEVATVSVFKLGGTGNLYRITYVGCTSYGWAVNIERVALG